MNNSISGLSSPNMNSNRFSTEPIKQAKTDSPANEMVPVAAEDTLQVPASKTSERSEPAVEVKDFNLTELMKSDKDMVSFLSDNSIALEFSIDQDTKRMIMKVIDSETNEVIRQFPPDVSLKIARIVANKSEKGYFANVTI